MKVLSVSSEVFPLIKTGGLADVSGALPIALNAFGVETKTLLPGYPAVMKVIRDPVVRLEFADLLGEKATVLEVQHEGLDVAALATRVSTASRVSVSTRCTVMPRSANQAWALVRNPMAVWRVSSGWISA